MKKKEVKILDTFAGAGGFSLGFSLAGASVIGAIESDEWAAETFAFNHPESNVIVADITKLKNAKVLSNFGSGQVDILLGGPPCQGFSHANRNAGDPHDPRNSLFMEFLRVAKVIQPRLVIMENVPNIQKAKTKSGVPVVDIIQNELQRIGYHTYSKVLEAVDYGVPQIRKRFLVIGSASPLSRPFPSATHRISTGSNLFDESLLSTPTLWDAISDLPEIEAGEGAEQMEYAIPPQTEFQRLLRENTSHLYNHKAMSHSKRMVERFKSMSWGDSTSDVPEHLMPLKRNGNGEKSEKAYDQNNRRMYADRPCHTIAASFYANFVHPYINRNFTPREGARIQSFPDWYIFKGKPTVVSHKLLQREGRFTEKHLCQYNQIGNAVPPLLAKTLALNLFAQL